MLVDKNNGKSLRITYDQLRELRTMLDSIKSGTVISPDLAARIATYADLIEYASTLGNQFRRDSTGCN